MTAYRPGDHDLLLAQWWARLSAQPTEFAALFLRSMRPLSAFLAWFQPPRVLLFETDELGIWGAVWFDPVMSGAFTGVWLAPERRHSRASLRFMEQAWASALCTVSPLIAVTRRPELVAPLMRLGYITNGRVPFLFDGADAYILYLTPDTFEQARRRRWAAAAAKAKAPTR